MIRQQGGNETEVTHAVARAPRGCGKGAAGREAGDVNNNASNEPTNPRPVPNPPGRGCSTEGRT